MKVCPSCGTSNPDSAKFCLECGTRLNDPSPAEPPTSAPIAEEAPEPAATAEPEAPGESESVTEPTEAPVDQPARPKKDVSGLPPSWMPTPVTLPSRPASTPTEPPARKAEPVPTPEPAAVPEFMPTPVDFAAERARVREAIDDDWKMSDPGPLPPPPKRRLWLWIPVGLIAAVLICCIAVFIWATTIGEDTVDRWATNAAVHQTEEASSGD